MAETLLVPPAAKKIVTPVQIRWMIRRDMAEVLRIERESFEYPWCEGDFLHCLRQRSCIGMIAEYRNEVVGFMIYELFQGRLHLLNFAIAKAYRRQKVGSQMIQKIINKLSAQRRNTISLEIRESNLIGQKFFRSLEFRAYTILRNHYEDTNEEAYAMRYQEQ